MRKYNLEKTLKILDTSTRESIIGSDFLKVLNLLQLKVKHL